MGLTLSKKCLLCPIPLEKGVTCCTGIPLPLPKVLGLAEMSFEALSLEPVNILLNTVLEGSPLAEVGILRAPLSLEFSGCGPSGASSTGWSSPGEFGSYIGESGT